MRDRDSLIHVDAKEVELTGYELYYGRRNFKKERTVTEAVESSVQTIATLLETSPR
jgi:hypothetical protein